MTHPTLAGIAAALALTLGPAASAAARPSADDIRAVRIIDPAQIDNTFGHSHNDYDRERPLFEAMEAGMRSVEADVILVDRGNTADLYVAHDPPDIAAGGTLRALYLDPLWRMVHDAAGAQDRENPSDHSLILMIDIKSGAERTYEVLRRQLALYEPMLTIVDEDHDRAGPRGVVAGPVTIVLSGNRPIATVHEEERRLVFIDGRREQLGEPDRPLLIPIVSNNWSVLGPLARPDADRGELRRRLESLAGDAADAGQMLRFWAAPDDEDTWELLFRSGVQLIHTDRPSDLGRFLTDGPATRTITPPARIR